MPTNTLNGRSFEVDSEGFMTRREEWDEELAADLASLIGLELTDEHWAVIRFLREDAAATGATPNLNRVQTAGGFGVRDLYRMFPGKPAKKMAFVAGLPKPAGCV